MLNQVQLTQEHMPWLDPNSIAMIPPKGFTIQLRHSNLVLKQLLCTTVELNSYNKGQVFVAYSSTNSFGRQAKMQTEENPKTLNCPGL